MTLDLKGSYVDPKNPIARREVLVTDTYGFPLK